ncbi:hypothetical protein ACWPKO_02885 [Coraliomargarita sp. W4R53]
MSVTTITADNKEIRHTRDILKTIPKNLIEDPTLSLKAKGLWLYMRSKPSGHQFAAARIAKETRDSITSVSSGISELRKEGYLTSKREESGHIQYRLYEQKHGEAFFIFREYKDSK